MAKSKRPVKTPSAKAGRARSASAGDSPKPPTAASTPARGGERLRSSGRLDPWLHMAASHGAGQGVSIMPLSKRTGTAAGAAAPPLGKTGGRAGRSPKARGVVAAAANQSSAARTLASRLSRPATKALMKRQLVPVLIETENFDAAAPAIAEIAHDTTRVSASTVVARVPMSRLSEIAAAAGVRYVEASVQLAPHCDLAHGSAGLVTAGARTVPQRGAGVLVGVVDTGIDTTHEAFWNGATPRIVHYLDQTANDRTYDAAQVKSGASAASQDTIGHGTHVSGIAAGNGRGSAGSQFAGVAPAADIAVVKTTFDTGDIAKGIARIFEVASQRNQPCVVNLSLGGHFGAHDGSSVLERVIDQQSGPGRIVVASAGNEGDARMHAGTVLVRDDANAARWVARFELRARMVDNQNVGLLAVQVWHQREDRLKVELRSPNGQLFAPPPNGDLEVDRTVFYVQCSHQTARYSGDHCTTFTIVTEPDNKWLAGWSIIVTEDRTVAGTSTVNVGTVHAWILDRDMGGFNEGFTRSHLVGMPGTAYSAITVASYATRRAWTSVDPDLPDVELDAVNLEDASYFSSPGPTRDGDTKPEVCAPGQWLIAPLSQDADPREMPDWLQLPGRRYAALQGTSMAAPYVTGAVALLLEKNPTMDWAEVKRRLIKSTRQDRFTLPCWNPRWGYGKIDVARLLTVEPE